MRRLLFAALSSVCLYGQTIRPIDTGELQEAKKPVEVWMGQRLVILDDGTPRVPEGATPVRGGLVRHEAGVGAEAITVTRSQLAAARSSQELAEFLAHAAAHARLGHPERTATLRKAVGILGPGRAGSVLQAETVATMEKEAEAGAVEFMESAGCAPGPCAMFGLLLRAARQP